MTIATDLLDQVGAISLDLCVRGRALVERARGCEARRASARQDRGVLWWGGR